MLLTREDTTQFMERFQHLSLDNLLLTNNQFELIDDTENDGRQIKCPFLVKPKTREYKGKNIRLISPEEEVAHVYMEIGDEKILRKIGSFDISKEVEIRPFEFLYMRTFVPLHSGDLKLPGGARIYLHAGKRNDEEGISLKYKGKKRYEVLQNFPFDLFTTPQHARVHRRRTEGRNAF